MNLDNASIKIGEQVDRGGYCEICTAHVDEDGDYVAKRLFVTASETDKRRFLREIEIQSSLDHPNIAKVLGTNTACEPYYYLMLRASGNFADFIDSTRPNDVLLYFYQFVLNGIRHAHANGVIHRDIKPHNILLYKDKGGEYSVQVSDFGIGKITQLELTTLTQTREQLGTVAYMAPEQYDDAKRVDARADIYALGKILYAILTRRVPFPNLKLDLIPGEYRYVVEKACADEPKDRFQSVDELARALQSVTEENDSLTSPEEKIKLLAKEFEVQPSRITAQRLSAIVSQHAHNHGLLLSVVPSAIRQILPILASRYSPEFRTIFSAYDAAATGGLEFSYCDVLANFYKFLFTNVQDDSIRTSIIKRLGDCGYRNNRFYVGEVFGELLIQARSPQMVVALENFLSENSIRTRWLANYVNTAKLPHKLISEFNRARKAND